MKLRLPVHKQKLQATAARRIPQQRAVEEDEEPTTKLSSAFFVVLILHVVAIGGIYMFASIKTHHPAALEDSEAISAKADREADLPVQPSAQSDAPATASVAANTGSSVVPAAAVVTHKVSEPVKSVEAPKVTAAAVAGLRDSGNIHTVTRGENPVLIARKLGVSYDDLLKLNHIDDPKKLQIGQKLHIPMKARTASN